MRPRVLVIDDSPHDLDLVQRILEGANYEAIRIDHPASALRAVHELRPDCIILDILMHDRSGFTLLGQIKEHADTSAIPVLVSASDHGSREHVERLGGIWVPKPWRSEHLVALLRSHIGSDPRHVPEVQSPSIAATAFIAETGGQ